MGQSTWGLLRELLQTQHLNFFRTSPSKPNNMLDNAQCQCGGCCSPNCNCTTCGCTTRSCAFSAEISSCFMFSPTASSSCSTSLNLPSANSARSVALFNSSSWTPNFLVSSSSFCSLSEAILVVSLKFLSASSISTSFLMVLFSKCLTFFKIPSASLEAMANLVTVSANEESAFLASSSINMIRLERAERLHLFSNGIHG